MQMDGFDRPATAPTQKVVVVNGGADVMEMLEPALAGGRYDLMFASFAHAYSQIKSAVPDLVILCTGIDESEGFQLLTMLKLDSGTRHVPVLTCATERDDPSLGVSMWQLAEDDAEGLPAVCRARRMN